MGRGEGGVVLLRRLDIASKSSSVRVLLTSLGLIADSFLGKRLLVSLKALILSENKDLSVCAEFASIVKALSELCPSIFFSEV